MVNTGEDRLQGVVIGLCHRIELVFMAAAAAGANPKKGRAGGVDHVIQLVHALHNPVLGILPLHQVVGAGHEEAGADRCSQCVACELFAHKLVVGFVGVQ